MVVNVLNSRTNLVYFCIQKITYFKNSRFHNNKNSDKVQTFLEMELMDTWRFHTRTSVYMYM